MLHADHARLHACSRRSGRSIESRELSAQNSVLFCIYRRSTGQHDPNIQQSLFAFRSKYVWRKVQRASVVDLFFGEIAIIHVEPVWGQFLPYIDEFWDLDLDLNLGLRSR
jgi:hypothetical protein